MRVHKPNLARFSYGLQLKQGFCVVKWLKENIRDG